MTTRWGRERAEARTAGRYHAMGGPDKRHLHGARGNGAEYDEGYLGYTQEVEAQQAEAAVVGPLHSIVRDANHLFTMSSNNEVAEIAGLIERLAEYLITKESTQ